MVWKQVCVNVDLEDLFTPQRQDLEPEQTARAGTGWSALGVCLPERGSQPVGYMGSVFICLLSGASTDLFVWRQEKKKKKKKWQETRHTVLEVFSPAMLTG